MKKFKRTETQDDHSPPADKAKQKISHEERYDWYRVIHAVKEAIVSKYSPIAHIYDGEYKFIFEVIEAVVHEEPINHHASARFRHEFHIKEVQIDEPQHRESNQNEIFATYPTTARWRDLSYVSSVKVQLLHYCYRVVNQDDVELARNAQALDDVLKGKNGASSAVLPEVGQEYLHDFGAHVIDLRDIYIQVKGPLCRIKITGQNCREDPEDLGGYHIYKGTEKFTESQYFQRCNYPYVHFVASASSLSQGTSASSASSEDTSVTNEPLILKCDYRTMNDTLLKFDAAFHLYLSVRDGKAIRAHLDRVIRGNHYDAECFDDASSRGNLFEHTFTPDQSDIYSFIPNVSNQESSSNLASSKHYSQYGYGEALTLSFPNVKQTNLNLVFIFFMLGYDTRLQMLRCICNDEYEVLKRVGLIDEQGQFLPVNKDDLALLKKINTPLVKNAIIIYKNMRNMLENQSLFPPKYDVNPYKIYYPPEGVSQEEIDRYASVPGTYEYFYYNEMPLVGIPETIPDEAAQSKGAWKQPEGYTDKYITATLDGWDRTAAVAHFCRILCQKNADGSATKKRMKIEARKLLDANESVAIMKEFARFKKSFLQEFMPNMGVTAHWRTMITKRIAFGSIVQKIILVYLGFIPPDDMDHARQQCFDTVGTLMAKVFRHHYTTGLKQLMSSVVSQYEDNVKVCNWLAIASQSFPPDPFKTAFSKGVWSHGGKSVMEMSGTTHRLLANNKPSQLEQMRKVRHVANSKSRLKSSSMQKLNPSQDGLKCPLKTYNDKKAGMDNYLAKVRVRVGYEGSKILAVVMAGAMEPTSSRFHNFIHPLHSLGHAANSEDEFLEQVGHLPFGAMLVKVNDGPAGFTFRPGDCLAALKRLKVENLLPSDVGITWVGGPLNDGRELDYSPMLTPFGSFISIRGDWGVDLRPVFVVKNIWKLPHIVATYTSAAGIFPNFVLARLAYKYPPPLDWSYVAPNLHEACRPGSLFDKLLEENVIAYYEAEELCQEYACVSLETLMNEHPQVVDGKIMVSQNEITPAGHSKMAYIQSTLKTNPAQRMMRTRNGFSAGGNATRIPYTICYISVDLMTGMMASLTPCISSTDPCRQSYATGHGQQAASILSLNHRYRRQQYDKTLMIPTRSLARSFMDRHFSSFGAGGSATSSFVLFGCRRNNGEDAIVHSRSDFGKYHIRHTVVNSASAYVTIEAAPKVGDDNDDKKKSLANPSTTKTSNKNNAKSNTTIHVFAKPNKESCMTLRSTNYDAINRKGRPKLGATMRHGDALMARIFKAEKPAKSVLEKSLRHGGINNANTVVTYRDSSITNMERMPITVEQLIDVEEPSGLHNLIVVSSNVRMPEIGDKFCSRHGQKGVAGNILANDRMSIVIDESGRAHRADEERNPCGFVSRQSISEKKEVMHSSMCLKEGRIKTVHSSEDASNMQDLFDSAVNDLELKAMNSYMVMNPITGRPLRGVCFGGVFDYEILDHLGRETMNSRRLGLVDVLTHQPIGGSRGGSAKEGTMEGLNKISQGVPDITQQTLCSGSDPIVVCVCQMCGLFAERRAPLILLDEFGAEPAIATGAFSFGSSSTNPNDKANLRRDVFRKKTWHIQHGLEHINPYKNEAFGSTAVMTRPRGWCGACRRSDTVFEVRMPSSIKRFIDLINTENIAWRLVLEVNPYKKMSLNAVSNELVMEGDENRQALSQTLYEQMIKTKDENGFAVINLPKIKSYDPFYLNQPSLGEDQEEGRNLPVRPLSPSYAPRDYLPSIEEEENIPYEYDPVSPAMSSE